MILNSLFQKGGGIFIKRINTLLFNYILIIIF